MPPGASPPDLRADGPAGAAPYEGLTPDTILDALASVGLEGDGRLLALNSYENRVYQVWLDDGRVVVAKFYRPQRWSDEQILEEHAFAAELAEEEVPVVAPLVIDGATLLSAGGFRFAVFPRRGGRTPELDDSRVLEWVGRFVGRIHLVGGRREFARRPAIDIERLGREPVAFLLAADRVPVALRPAWVAAVDQALEAVSAAFDRLGSLRHCRLHGDCHVGNVLWTDDGPHFVDLDDACNGPAIQDLWMLLSGDRASMTRQFCDVLAGYEDFVEFDRRELGLIEPLRTLRLVHYSAWIARRWEDPAFPAAFPWFGTERYWQDRILELREQIAAMSEPPLGPV
ncbi:MAG: serine/threonine protein kinase [Burkholderiaceae bacterium]|jgi:Ser/Thr protein kinase RdoA (MazF antagonist)|nr:serine/threonine protein kinase [Burkholderiaceae bacterium]